MKVSIIIPAYNEEKRIPKTLEGYYKFFKVLKNKRILDFEILVVINCSTDKTEKLVKLSCKKNSEIKCICLDEKGKGLAIIEGFKDATKRENDLIGFVDADMATSPEAFYDLVKNIGDSDGIIASRYIKGAIVDPKPITQRIIASRVFNFMIRSLFLMPFIDTQCGAKLLKKKPLEEIINELVITRWAFDVDLLFCLNRKRFKIKEFPTVWSDKEYSKINFKRAGPLMAISIIRLRILNSPFRDLVRLYNKMPEWLKIHHKI